jgi:hypothetical protein
MHKGKEGIVDNTTIIANQEDPQALRQIWQYGARNVVDNSTLNDANPSNSSKNEQWNK